MILQSASPSTLTLTSDTADLLSNWFYKYFAFICLEAATETRWWRVGGVRWRGARLHACNALSESRLNVVVSQCPPLPPPHPSTHKLSMLTHSAHSIRFSCSFCCYLQPIMRQTSRSRSLKSPIPSPRPSYRLTWALKSKKYSGLSGQGRPHLQVPCDSK